MVIGPDDLFLVVDGVHRCVAAKLLGIRSMKAVIDNDGIHSEVCEVDLDKVRSSKSYIYRWHKKRDFEDFVSKMSTAMGRERLPPIIVTKLGAARAQYFVPVERIFLQDEVEE